VPRAGQESERQQRCSDIQERFRIFSMLIDDLLAAGQERVEESMLRVKERGLKVAMPWLLCGGGAHGGVFPVEFILAAPARRQVEF
jgi:hypothetical protein